MVCPEEIDTSGGPTGRIPVPNHKPSTPNTTATPRILPLYVLGKMHSDWNEEIWEFPRIWGTFLGLPIIRTIVFGGLYWGTHILGNYHLLLEAIDPKP